MINNELQNRILSSIIIIPIAIFFVFQGSIFFAFFLSIFFLATSYEWIKMNKKDILKVIGVFFLFFASYSSYLLREKFSLGIFILILIICIFTDLGGYIFGKTFKGPKLTKISPKKTYAGAFGSFILSLIAAIIFTKYTNIGIIAHTNLSLRIGNNLELDNMFFLFILFISFISQIGDLIISYFKRLAKIKDTGKLLPGHGGLLDRVDGIIFAIPTSYLVLNF
jgi:phosphatidate cytidylyltransferase|tara:strand:- start:1616 stop:2284 length:669 start_codon:yes stop_codon:yes gene_type:complete